MVEEGGGGSLRRRRTIGMMSPPEVEGWEKMARGDPEGERKKKKRRRRKIVLVLVDGVGDVGVPKLDMKTPLQKSECPVLDSIASAWLLRCRCCCCCCGGVVVGM